MSLILYLFLPLTFKDKFPVILSLVWAAPGGKAGRRPERRENLIEDSLIKLGGLHAADQTALKQGIPCLVSSAMRATSNYLLKHMRA